MYAGVEASVLNNGHLTPRFTLTQGFWQGDPLSPVNFVILQQIFITKLKKNQEITGIQVNTTQKMIGLFADDMWAIFYGTEQNLK